MTDPGQRPRFLAIGRHGPVDPEEGRRIGARSLVWLEEQLANGVLEAVYSLEGGGRALIARADDADSLLTMLRAAPDVERDWQINRLHDGLDVIRRYLEATDPPVA